MDRPDLVTEWLRDVRGAIEYVNALGAPRVGVIGLRLGATLAGAELARGGGVDDLVLWDPCATGRAFLRGQRALSAFGRDETSDAGTGREAAQRPAQFGRRAGRGTRRRVLRNDRLGARAPRHRAERPEPCFP